MNAILYRKRVLERHTRARVRHSERSDTTINKGSVEKKRCRPLIEHDNRVESVQ